jgi:hypothetical protein
MDTRLDGRKAGRSEALGRPSPIACTSLSSKPSRLHGPHSIERRQKIVDMIATLTGEPIVPCAPNNAHSDPWDHC